MIKCAVNQDKNMACSCSQFRQMVESFSLKLSGGSWHSSEAYELVTWYTDGELRPVLPSSAMTAKVKVIRLHGPSDRCWPITLG